jgi:hypothetical protein
MAMRTSVLAISILSCGILFGQQPPKAKLHVHLEPLRLEEVSNGCGIFYGLVTPHQDSTEYVFASAPKSDDMVLRVNGKLYVVKQISRSSSGNQEHRETMVGDHFTETYAGDGIRVQITCTVDEDLGEGFSFNGKMKVTIQNVTKIFKIAGSGGC